MDDKKIIGLFYTRSDIALREVESKYSALLKKIAKNITSNDEDSEEIVNDVLLAAWNSIPPALPESLPAYLGTIARNKSLNKIRSKKSVDYYLPTDELLDLFPDCDDVMDSGEISQAIRYFLDTQNSLNRTIFIRRYWMCEPVKNIAKTVGLSAVNVSTRINRMKTSLKKVLFDRGIYL